MKKLFLALALLTSIFSFAEDREVAVKSTIKDVTVYLSGAVVHRYGSVNLPAGRSVLKFEGLSGTMNPKSIQADLSGNARIISISYERDFLRPVPPSKRHKEVTDSIDAINYQLEDLNAEIQVLEQEKKVLLDNNRRLGEKEGIKTSELELAANFYQKRLMTIYKDLLKRNRKKNELNKTLKRLVSQRNVLKTQLEQATYNALVIIDNPSTYKANVHVSYAVRDAAWTPRYNLRSDGPGSPMDLEYMALVANQTGMDWKNVNLVLSTGDPSKSMTKPTMDTWTLNYSNRNTYNEGRLQNRATRDNFYSYDEVEEEPMFERSIQYSEVEVSELSVDFTVKDPYTIPGDARPQLVQVNEFKLDKVKYEYFAIPKVDKDAFLLAKVTEWEKLNLVDGPANVYFNGRYVGESSILTRYSADTLAVSLGRDPKVIVTRVKKEDSNSKKIIGMNRKVTLSYELAVRNTHSENIDIQMLSQVPVSQESDIEVTVHEISGASKDEENGKLEWRLNVAPAETKKVHVSFSIKYPKKKDLKIRKSRKMANPSQFW